MEKAREREREWWLRPRRIRTRLADPFQPKLGRSLGPDHRHAPFCVELARGAVVPPGVWVYVVVPKCDSISLAMEPAPDRAAHPRPRGPQRALALGSRPSPERTRPRARPARWVRGEPPFFPLSTRTLGSNRSSDSCPALDSRSIRSHPSTPEPLVGIARVGDRGDRDIGR